MILSCILSFLAGGVILFLLRDREENAREKLRRVFRITATGALVLLGFWNLIGHSG